MRKLSSLERNGLCAMLLAALVPGGAPAQADTDSPYGVVGFVPSVNRWNAIQNAGIGWVRCPFSWRDIETPQKGTFNWALTDDIVAQANARGLRLYASLGYTPTWASSGGQSYSPPSNPQDWYDFVLACVNRYKASVKYWEIWNEPNLSIFWGGTRQQYIDNILKVGSDAAHAADPDCMVGAPECGEQIWVRDALQLAGDKVDFIAMHQYGPGGGVQDTPATRIGLIDSMHNYVVSLGYGNKPIWVTESGWASDDPGMTEQLQASYLVAMLDGMLSRPWWRKFVWYQIWEGPPGSGQAGLLYQNETPKPAWYSYRDYTLAHPAPQIVSVNLSTTDIQNGINLVTTGDGNTTPDTRASRRCRRNTNPGGAFDYYMYFNVADSFAYQGSRQAVYVTVDYYDVGSGALSLEYDSISGGAYKNAGWVAFGGLNTWKQYRFQLSDAYFGNRQNGGADFRVYANLGTTFYIDVVQVDAIQQAPYGGTARTIPGTLQAEDYDLGGQGVAYYDTSATNDGGQYRTSEGVDLEVCSDTGGGYDIGWILPGEWQEWTVNVPNTGDHTFKVRLSSCCSSGTFTLKMNGNTIANAKSFNVTGGWQTWTTITLPAIYLTAGNNQILQILFNTGNLNLNKIDVGYGGADAVHVDLASTNYLDGMTHPQFGDGDTTGASIGGHNCRRNVNGPGDRYMYFGIDTGYAYQGNRPDVWITVEYYDTGTYFFELHYDASSNPYKSGGAINLTNTNTWKTKSYHVTDGYFGNRQNAGADYRFYMGGNSTWYLDTVQTSLAQP